MGKMKYIPALAAAILLFGGIAQAEPIDRIYVDPVTFAVTVTGTVPGTADSVIRMTVVRPGKTIEEYATLGIKNVLCYAREITPADDTGLYEETFSIDGEKGDYTLRIAADSMAAPAEQTFFYFSDADVEAARTAVNAVAELTAEDAAKRTALQTVLEENLVVLGLEESYAAYATAAQKEQFFTQVLAALPLAQVSDLTELAGQWALVCNINNATDAAQLEQCVAAYAAKNPAFADLSTYKNYLARTDKTAILQALCSLTGAQTLQSSDAFAALFHDAVISTLAGEAVGWGDMHRLISEYDDVLSLSMTDYHALQTPSAVDKALMEKKDSIAGVSDLEAAFSDAVKAAQAAENEKTTTSRKNTGSGGGGGGSSSSSSSSNINYEINAQQLEEIQAAQSQPEKTEQAAAAFSDLDSVPWAQEAIVALTEQGVLSGREADRFYPNDLVTRAEFVKMLVTAAGMYQPDGICDFTDLPSDHWAYTYVGSAVAQAMVQGREDGSFGAELLITRQDAAVMLCRLLQNRSYAFTGTAQGFADQADIAPYAIDAVAAIRGEGILTGYPDGTFAPGNSLTRAEAAVIVYRLYGTVF